MDKIEIDKLTEIGEFKAVLNLYDKAKGYIDSFDWCIKTLDCWYDKDYSLYDKLAVFLFNIQPLNDNVDDYIWIIVGDLPSVYLDKSITNGKEALEAYCDLMSEWSDNVKDGFSVSQCYPVVTEPTIDNAVLLDKRIAFIKQNILMIE